MSDVIKTIGSAIEAVKILADLAKTAKNADAKMAIADLSVALADIKLEVAALKEENLRLAGELRSAIEKPDRRDSIMLQDGVYFVKGGTPDAPNDGPFCTRCFDVDDNLIRLTEFTGAFRTFGRWKCPECREHFG